MIPLPDDNMTLRLDPMRPPDWRWRTSLALAGRSGSQDLSVDEPIRATVRYLQLGESRPGSPESVHHPDHIRDAIGLGHDMGWAALEVRARILARQSPRAIARHTGYPIETLLRFEELFFHVSDRLKAGAYVDWVINSLPGRSPAVRMFLRMAHARGSGVIGPWMDFLNHAGEEHDLTTAEGRTREALELAVEAYLLPVDAIPGERAPRLLTLIDDVEARRARPRTVGEVFTSGLVVQLHDLEWAEPVGWGTTQPVPTGDTTPVGADLDSIQAA